MYNIYNATGRTDLALKTEILKKTIFIVIFLLTMKYKIQILLIGLIIISIIEMLIDVYMAKKQIGITFIDEFKSLIGVLGASLIMCIFVIIPMLMISSSIIQLFVGFFVGIIVYVTICYLFNIANFKIEVNSYASKYRK